MTDYEVTARLSRLFSFGERCSFLFAVPNTLPLEIGDTAALQENIIRFERLVARFRIDFNIPGALSDDTAFHQLLNLWIMPQLFPKLSSARLRSMLKFGADPCASNTFHVTPTMIALRSGFFEL